MSQLEDEDMPKTSSSGARRRQVRLIVQLPAQDLAARFCRQLHGADKQQQLEAFDEFRRTRDADALDVAHVTSAVKHRTVV